VTVSAAKMGLSPSHTAEKTASSPRERLPPPENLAPHQRPTPLAVPADCAQNGGLKYRLRDLMTTLEQYYA